MLNSYPKLSRGHLERLSDKEESDLEKYFAFRKARGLNSRAKADDIKRILHQLRNITQKPLDDLNLDEVMTLTGIIKASYFGDYQKNEILTALKSYLKWKIPNWSSKLKLDDVRLVKNPISKCPITPKDLLTKEDIEKLMKHETKMYWKAFLMLQYEAGLRTKEARFLRWEDLQLNKEEDLSEINIHSTKTKKQRSLFVKEATFYLSKLKDEQSNLDKKGVYIFYSKRDINEPIGQANVSLWFSRLTKRVLGKERCWNYLLRHSRGSELYKLAKQGKISKDIAVEFMGHTQEMSKVYTHINDDEMKKMVKEQVYHIEELPQAKKLAIEKEVEGLKQQMSEMNEIIFSITSVVQNRIGLMKEGKNAR